jgi:hypothetical protein
MAGDASCWLRGELMSKTQKVRLTRRDMLKLSAGGAGLFALTASGFAVPRGFAGGGGSLYIEAFPTSPLVLNPVTDDLIVPKALRPADPNNPTNPQNVLDPDPKNPNVNQIHPTDRTCQDSFQFRCKDKPDTGPRYREYQSRYGYALGTQSVWCDDLKLPEPIVYKIDLEVAQHKFTTQKVLPIDSNGKAVVPPGRGGGAQYLPASTIYGFNGTFPGPRINSEYGQPALVHFCNHLDQNPNNYDRQDFGSPSNSFLTHLHNGHTAPESDGQPHYSGYRFEDMDER